MGIVTTQLIGMGACFVWAFGLAFIMFKVIAATIGLRVSAEEEIEGLDFVEHGGNAYPISNFNSTSIPRKLSPF